MHFANRNFIAGTLFAASLHSVDYTKPPKVKGRNRHNC
jgi:hypothetical protein